ncbi:MAG: dTDP-glucose 4,6-dehydratase [Candidatus Binatia bacterium]
MRTVVVTGGCGFIGSHFVHCILRRGEFRVVNLDKLTYAGDRERVAGVESLGPYRFVQGDIADRTLVGDLFRDERPWAVVNFAAESHVDRSILDLFPFFQTNLTGAQVLLEAAQRCGVQRFVQISTDEVYGDADGKEPFGEESAITPSSPYAASKAAADLLCLAFGRTYDFPVLIVRSSNNYGPFQFPEKLIPFMIASALSGKELPLYGDGLQRRDWLYVEDNCRAILEALERGRPRSIYNVGVGESRTNQEIVHAICRLLSEEGRLDLDSLIQRIRFVSDRPGHDREYALCTQRTRHELAWSPRVSFETGMRETVRWYLEHEDWVKRVTSGEYQAYYDAVYKRGWERSGI